MKVVALAGGALLILLVWLAAYSAFWLGIPTLAILALLVVLVAVAVVTILGGREFRAGFGSYSCTSVHHLDSRALAMTGRLTYAPGKGFGLTTARASGDGIEISVLRGLVGRYWFPTSELISLEVVGPRLENGLVSSLRWSMRGGQTLTFTPWFGDVQALAGFLRNSRA